jgi:hypothetical protein
MIRILTVSAGASGGDSGSGMGFALPPTFVQAEPSRQGFPGQGRSDVGCSTLPREALPATRCVDEGRRDGGLGLAARACELAFRLSPDLLDLCCTEARHPQIGQGCGPLARGLGVTSTSNNAQPHDGRWFRVACLGVLAAGYGSDLFEDLPDLWLAVPRFVLMSAATAALIWELTTQAQRHPQGTAAVRWSRSDTVNASVMAGYAALLCATVTLSDLRPKEETAGPMFAALYLALAIYFLCLRRRTLVQHRSTAAFAATPAETTPQKTI